MALSQDDVKRREDYEIQVIIGANQRSLKAEDRVLRLHLDCKSLRRGPGQDIMATCNNPKCRHVNNISANRSTFCIECGMLLTDRHY